ncbi:MAG: glycosyltransferase family 4 protein [Syntrophobacterales bacterium]|nr:glycosyltransferase family 4 protein [Syntrophobacterales bacterium]
MEKPRILCISALPPPYHGVSIANEILLKSKLLHENFNIKIVQLRKPKLQPGGKFSVSTLSSDFGTTFNILRELTFFKPHLTYVGIAQTKLGLWRDGTWIRLATWRGSKVLSHMHGGHFRYLFEYELDRLSKRFVEKTLERLQGIIVLDHSLAYLFHGLVDKSRIFVLPNGIPDPYNIHHLAEVNRQRAQQKKLRVTYLSNLIPGKGFDTFLEAAALLRDEDFIFNLAGAPANPVIANQVREFVGNHELEGQVRILGKVVGKEKYELLLCSDVFVFPTYYHPEGQPFVIIEALAAGLPVIATTRGCIPAMVRDEHNGFIVSEKNPEEIADRLRLLKDNVKLRLSMGDASRQIYLENYTKGKFVDGFYNILKKII